MSETCPHVFCPGEFSQSTMGNRRTSSRRWRSGPLSPGSGVAVAGDKVQLRVLRVGTPQTLLGTVVVSSRVSFIQLT